MECPAQPKVVMPDAVSIGVKIARASLLQRTFSFPAMLGLFLIGAVFALGYEFRVDPDLWWHIKVGENILATHRFPMVDPYSFTATGQPWIAYEWLGEVLFGAVERIAGIQGLYALLVVLGSAVILTLYFYASIRSGNSKAAFLVTSILLPLAAASFNLRPQMLGYLFLVITLAVLELFRQGRQKPLWILPLLILIWTNTHGSWIIGLGVIAVYWASGLVELNLGGIEARRWTAEERCRISFIFLLCVAVTPITPYGVRVAASPFEYAFDLPLNVAHILEWQPMPFNIVVGKLFLFLLIGFIIAQVALRLTWRLEELLLFLGGTVLACLHVRFVLLFVPFFAPILATILARWLPSYARGKDRYRLNAALMTAAIVAMIWYFPAKAHLQRKVAAQFPAKAVAYLSNHPVAGPMFNTYGFGGYLIWSRGPEHKLFIDGRGDLYERGGVFADYMHITSLKPGSLTVLRNYGIQSCLIYKTEPLATLLSASPDWQPVYRDNLSILFVRRQAPEASSETVPKHMAMLKH